MVYIPKQKKKKAQEKNLILEKIETEGEMLRGDHAGKLDLKGKVQIILWSDH